MNRGKTYHNKVNSGSQYMDLLLQRRREEHALGSEGVDTLERDADEAAQQIVHGEGIDATNLSSTSTEPQSKHDEFSASLEKSIEPQLDGSKGGGQPLDESVKDEMEGKMNTDLSDVRIHTDSNANKMSEDINAKAFAHGQDVYFKNGNFDTSSLEGKELLAHELTHTRQQGGGQKLQRQIDKKGSWRIIQDYMGVKITGIKSDFETQTKLKDNEWSSDESILHTLFGKIAGTSVTEMDAYKEITRNSEINGALNKVKNADAIAKTKMNDGEKEPEGELYFLIERGTQSGKSEEIVQDIKTEILKAIPKVFDLNPQSLSTLNTDLEIEEEEKIKAQNFNISIIELEEAVTLNKKVSAKLGEFKQGEESIEALAKTAILQMSIAENLMPNEFQYMGHVPFYKSAIKGWEGSYSVGPEQGMHGAKKNSDKKEQIPMSLTNIAMFRKNVLLQIDSYLDDYFTALTNEKNNKSEKNKEILQHNQAAYLVSILRLLNTFRDGLANLLQMYTNLAEGYIDLIKEISEYQGEEFRNKITEGRKKELEKLSDVRKYQQLIEVVVDYMDINLIDENIFTIQYDGRVDKIIPDEHGKYNLHEYFKEETKDDAINKVEPILLNNFLLGVVIFERGNLKTIKVGVNALDNWQILRDTIDMAVKVKPPKLKGQTISKTNKRSFANQKENGTYTPNKSAELNNETFNDPRSVRIILDLIGAPQNDKFTEDSSDYIYAWQLTYSQKPKKEKIENDKMINERGHIRLSDLKVMYQQLVKNGKSGSFNAAIMLIADYYDLMETVLSLKSSDFQLPLDNYGPYSNDEVLLAMYYEKDALEDSTSEAGVAQGGTVGAPTMVRIGEGAFSSFESLVGVIAHELVHARQNMDVDTPSGAHELYAYYVNLTGKIGDKSIPKLTDQSSSDFFMRMVTREYLEIEKLSDLVDYAPMLKANATAAKENIADFNTLGEKEEFTESAYKEKIKKNSKFVQSLSSLTNQYTEEQLKMVKEYSEPITIYENAFIIDMLISFIISLGEVASDETLIDTANLDQFETSLLAFNKPPWKFPSTMVFGDNYVNLLPVSYKTSVLEFYEEIYNWVIKRLKSDIPNIEKKINNLVDVEEKKSLQVQLKGIKKIIGL